MNQHLMLPQLPPDQQMTIEEFLAFTATRPDEERWELVEGVPVLNASPTDVHQIVVTNIATSLMMEKAHLSASWLPMIGIGIQVPVSPNSLPQPDVFVKAGPVTGKPLTDDALVIFEVLSRSNTKADREWRKRVYSSVPNCQHYVTVSLKAPDVSVFDRVTNWAERRLKGHDAVLELPTLQVVLPLAIIYRWTPLV